MEKGIARLVEAARVAAEDMHEHVITLEVTPAGVRAKITWEVSPARFVSQENLTTWQAIHPRPDTKNPLLAALDLLVQARTEFQP